MRRRRRPQPPAGEDIELARERKRGHEQTNIVKFLRKT